MKPNVRWSNYLVSEVCSEFYFPQLKIKENPKLSGSLRSFVLNEPPYFFSLCWNYVWLCPSSPPVWWCFETFCDWSKQVTWHITWMTLMKQWNLLRRPLLLTCKHVVTLTCRGGDSDSGDYAEKHDITDHVTHQRQNKEASVPQRKRVRGSGEDFDGHRHQPRTSRKLFWKFTL